MPDSNATQKAQCEANMKPTRGLEAHGARTYMLQSRAAVPRHRLLVTDFASWWHGFHPRTGLMGFMVGNGSGADFLQISLFPVPVLIPPTAPYSSIFWGWYSEPTSGLRAEWTQSHPIPRS